MKADTVSLVEQEEHGVGSDYDLLKALDSLPKERQVGENHQRGDVQAHSPFGLD